MAKAPAKPRLNPKADLGLVIRIGGFASSTSGVGDNVASNVTRAMSDFKRKIDEKTYRVSNDELQAALIQGSPEIVAALREDIERFAKHAAATMFKFTSPDTPMRTSRGAEQRVTVAIDDVNRGLASSFAERGTAYRTAKENSLRDRLSGQSVVVWRALTYKTLRNKRAVAARGRLGADPRTFFVHSGDLFLNLSYFLPPAFLRLLDPQLTIREVKREDGKLVQRATVSVMTKSNVNFAKAGVSAQNLPGLAGGGSVTSGDREDVFATYLRQVGMRDNNLLAKLENPGGWQRPFLQNVLAYWILRRLPFVLRRSLEKVLASKSFRRSYVPK